MSQEKNKWKVEKGFFSSRKKKEHRSQHGKKKYHKNGERSNKTGLKEAMAPYNFIPLNEKVVEAEKIPGKDQFTFNRYHGNRYTGYINLEIVTQTPIYIRDSLNENELKVKSEIGKDKKKKYINPDFFSPGGKFRIPGSSLRGMIRTLVEIVSYGKFITFDDDRLYFRTFGGGLGKLYRNIMIDEKDNAFPKVKAGILKKEGKDYLIYPSRSIEDTQIYRVNYDIKSRIIKGGGELKVKEFDFKEVYFQPVSPVVHREHKFPLKYARLKSLSLKEDNQHTKRGFLVSSGQFSDRKHMHWVINEPDSNAGKIDLDNDLIKSYIDDVNRKVGDKADLIEYLDKNPKSFVPCFYVEIDGKVKSFGHTGMFRLAYNNKIGDYVSNNLKDKKNKDEKIIDIAEAIFGNKDDFSGRVFFEDAFLNQNQSDFLMEESIPQILAGPNPTSFQLYLEQNEDKLKSEGGNIRGLKHYNDSDAQIRGCKLYWHKSGKNWKESQISFKKGDFESLLKEKCIKEKDFGDSLKTKKDKRVIDLKKLDQKQMHILLDAIGIFETQHTKIKPIKEGIVFVGKVRFENLSSVELGALLFALDLPEDCCHKIGMGKPLGLGSVKIKPRLFISNRKKRYENLFAEWSEIKESTDMGKEINDFKEQFEKYILQHIGEESKGLSCLWDVDRIKQLKYMLDFSEKKPKDEETSYMKLEEFKERNILLKPSKVK